MGIMRAQTSIEFLYTMVFMLLVFTLVVVLYGTAQGDLAEISRESEFRAVCRFAASQISAIAISGNGTSIALSLPKARTQYSIFVSGPDRTVSVAAWERLSSCRISTSSVTNGSSNIFAISDGIRMTNTGGGVLFG
jgi:hypothetical protein